MIKYWLKLRSINTDLFQEVRRLIEENIFDFIELYILPEKFDKNKFKILQWLPISFHAPHGMHGFNPIDPKNNTEEIREIVDEYIQFFDPFAIVVHPEDGNDVSVLKKRLDHFWDNNILIENMPMKSIIDGNINFYGTTLGHIQEIQKFHNKFCFDFAKAKSSAVSQWLDPKRYVLDMIELMKPDYFHVSGFQSNTEADEHWDLWEWDQEMMNFMKDKLVDLGNKKDIFVVFECKKKDWLKNDVKNLRFFWN